MTLGCGWLWLAAALLTPAAHAAAWNVRVDQQSGLPLVTRGGAPALSSAFVFWETRWTWAHQDTAFAIRGPFDYGLAGTNRRLGFELASRIYRKSSRELVWEFDLDAQVARSEVTGGGISFRFDPAEVASVLGEPRVLPGNRGWAWGPARGSRVEMRFEPPLATVFRVRGPRPEIRAFFYKGEIPQGKRRYVATLSVSGNAVIAATDAERFGLDDPAGWPAQSLDPGASPVDLSFLNASERPAGKRGFLQARRDEFAFADGTVVRFWGTNLTAYALFGTSKEGVRRQARRLSALGFNLVRLHHHDSDWVDPNVFGSKQERLAHELSAAMLEKIDWWILCLREEGIYVWLDLHVGRTLTAADRIDGFEEISRGEPRADLKGYSYVNASIQSAMKRFNQAYVNHVNVHTGLRYKDDPAIVAMLVTNENDVTHHFGNMLLPDKTIPRHAALYLAQARAFAAKYRLQPSRIWRAWEPGPAKLFLNDFEQRFSADMIGHLRAEGVKVPIVNTSLWGDSPLSSLPALSTGGLIDVHAYAGSGELEKDPAYAPTLVHRIAAAQVAGLPLSVSEWNVEPFPVDDRHSLPLYVAGAASLQGWDALMQYAYTLQPLHTAGSPSNWNAYNDPSLLATLPAAALLYRRRDVQEGKTLYAFAPSKEQLFDGAVSVQNAVALRTAAETGRLVVVLPQVRELPWLRPAGIPAGARVITANQSIAGDTPGEIVSDTGELRRNWERGIYTVDSPRSQIATGWIGGRRIRLADVELTISTRSATVAVQSLDGNPIRTSSALLISLGARSVPRKPDTLPFHSEPVLGELAIQARKGLEIYARSSSEASERRMPAQYRDGRYHIALDRDVASHWLVLR